MSSASQTVTLDKVRVLADERAGSAAASLDLKQWTPEEFAADPEIVLLLFLSSPEAIRWVYEELLRQNLHHRIAGVVAWLLDEIHLGRVADWPLRLWVGSLPADNLEDFLGSDIGPHAAIKARAVEIDRLESIAHGTRSN